MTQITKIDVTSLVLGVTPRNFAWWQVVGAASTSMTKMFTL